jgi:hypothetical protein
MGEHWLELRDQAGPCRVASAKMMLCRAGRCALGSIPSFAGAGVVPLG